MELINKLLYAALITSALTIMLMAGGASMKNMITAFRNLFMMDITTAIIFFLCLSLALLEVVSYKLQGWYEGAYSNLVDSDSFNYKKKDEFPLLPEMDPTSSPQLVHTEDNKDYLDTTKLKKLTAGISSLELVLVSLIAVFAIISRYPVKVSMTPGATNLIPRLIPIAVVFYGIILAVIIFYSFWEIFEPIGRTLPGNTFKGLTTFGPSPSTPLDTSTNRFFAFTKTEHILPRPELFVPLLNLMFGCLFVAMGLCFAILTTNLAANSYRFMKNKAAYITNLSDEGRLMAYEFNDPLFKLVDHCIQKKSKSGDVTGDASIISDFKLSGESVRLFDVVKIKPRVSAPSSKALEGSLDDDSDHPTYLVAAVNDWTIIPNKNSERKFLNIGPENVSNASDTFSDEADTKYTRKDRYISKKQFAWSDKEKELMYERKETVENYLDPDIARMAIYGSRSVVKGVENYGGYPDRNSKVYLIPVDLSALREAPNRMAVIQKIVLDEFAEEIGEPIELDYADQAPVRVFRGAGGERLPVITDRDGNSVPEELLTGKTRDGSELSSRQRDIFIKLNKAFEKLDDRMGIEGRLYVRSNEKEPLFDGMFLRVEEKAQSKEERITNLSVALRVKENYNIHNISKEDLVYLRYGLVEAFGLRTTDKRNATAVQTKFNERLKYLPDPQRLLYQILPSIKEYADQDVMDEYTKEIGYVKSGGKTQNDETYYDVSSFAERFSTILMEHPIVAKKGVSGIEKGVSFSPYMGAVSNDLSDSL